MKIGIYLPTTPLGTPDLLGVMGRAVEERGFASVWAPDAPLRFDEPRSRFPYSKDGALHVSAEVGSLDPLLALGYVAATTRRIRLGIGTCTLPLRNPVHTAKALSSLDWLSKGRVDLGIGVGWSEDEYGALGVPWERREDRCREYLEVMRRLWTDAVSQYSGNFYELPSCRHYPKPIQRPHPPIYVGGEDDAALVRVSDVGAGWFGYNLGPDQARERVDRLRGLLAERGRRAFEVEVAIGTHFLAVDRSALDAYADARVDQLVLMPRARTYRDTDTMLAALDHLAREIVEPASRA